MADRSGAMSVKPRLGRGLAALIGDVGEEKAVLGRTRGQRVLPVAYLRPNPFNPRHSFDEDKLNELAHSIREKGLIQPILVRTVAGEVDVYEIIAGERRWRAAQQAGLHEIPVLLLEASDKEALALALIENIQRSDLNVLEEAAGYQRLIDDFGYSQQELAQELGKSRPYIANALRLLKLPEEIRPLVSDGRISAGHARALLTHPDSERVALEVVEKGLTVRQVEALAQEASQKAGRSSVQRKRKDVDIVREQIEKRFSESLGLLVSIRHTDQGGEIRIRYKTLEQLDELCRQIGV